MATTSIHIPEELLEKLDRLAADQGISRNKLIVASCREAVERHRDRWPPGYLAGAHLDAESRRLLSDGAREFAEGIVQARHSRRESPF